MLDLFSDIGGFHGMLILSLAMISNIWNHNNFANFLVSRLFKISRPKNEADSEEIYFKKTEFIDTGNFPYFLECFRSLIPRSEKCCKLNRREIAMKKARQKLEQEINIIEIVKSWRYFSRAIHHLLPEKKREHFKERSRYIAIDPDSDMDHKRTQNIALKK